MPRRALHLPLLFLLSAACFATSPAGDDAVEATEEEIADTPDNAIVLDYERLHRTDDWLLQAMESYIPQVRVNYNPGTTAGDRCPLVSLRGPLTGTALSNPLVYLNGTRMTNTCILTRIRTGELERVEIYPSGFTARSGYVTHPHGLILVFSRRI